MAVGAVLRHTWQRFSVLTECVHGCSPLTRESSEVPRRSPVGVQRAKDTRGMPLTCRRTLTRRAARAEPRGKMSRNVRSRCGAASCTRNGVRPHGADRVEPVDARCTRQASGAHCAAVAAWEEPKPAQDAIARTLPPQTTPQITLTVARAACRNGASSNRHPARAHVCRRRHRNASPPRVRRAQRLHVACRAHVSSPRAASQV